MTNEQLERDTYERVRDAYEGAREDLLDWRRRAQRAEAELRRLGYVGVTAAERPAAGKLPPLPPSLDEVHVFMGERSDDSSRWAAPAAEYFTAEQMRAYAQPYADRLAALEAGMRGLVAKWRSELVAVPPPPNGGSAKSYNCALTAAADELSFLLNRPADGGE